MCIVAKWRKISVASAGISEQVNASGVSLRLIMGVWEIVLKSILVLVRFGALCCVVAQLTDSFG